MTNDTERTERVLRTLEARALENQAIALDVVNLVQRGWRFWCRHPIRAFRARRALRSAFPN
jgi:hypothetical protein